MTQRCLNMKISPCPYTNSQYKVKRISILFIIHQWQAGSPHKRPAMWIYFHDNISIINQPFSCLPYSLPRLFLPTEISWTNIQSMTWMINYTGFPLVYKMYAKNARINQMALKIKVGSNFSLLIFILFMFVFFKLQVCYDPCTQKYI